MLKSLLEKIFGLYKSTKDTYEQKLDEQVKGFLGVEDKTEGEEPKKTSKPRAPRKKKS